ncbi:MAG: hypothetical protein ACFFAO_04830 [Candidatus Hermodarchaeota archaeon]
MKERNIFYLPYVYCIVYITFVLTFLRIGFYFLHGDLSYSNFFIYIMEKNRDSNYRTIYDIMENGVFEYYKENPLIEGNAIYLYFWYFMFYPFYIIPFEISVYIWDLLRLATVIYIARNIEKITESKQDILFYFIFSGIGYFADMYLNNTNWVIQFLLFESYLQLKKDNMILSGILYSLSTYKVILVIFPFVLLIVKKIKMRDLMYYFIPLTILCLPYAFFPNYFMQMISNWNYSANLIPDAILLNIFLIYWRIIQTAHLLFISLIILIFLENIKDKKWKSNLRFFIYESVFIIWVLTWLTFIVFTTFLVL